MNTILLDNQDEAVKRFFLSLPADSDGSVVELHGLALAWIPIGPFRPNKVGTICPVEGYCVGSVLQCSVRKRDIHAWNRNIANREIATAIRTKAVEIKDSVRLVVAAIEEDYNQSV